MGDTIFGEMLFEMTCGSRAARTEKGCVGERSS